jgi:hypothetical protein
MPLSATLLNTGDGVEASVDFVPSQFLEHGNREPYLRLKNLPVDDLCGEVLVIRLDFGDLAGTIAASGQEALSWTD